MRLGEAVYDGDRLTKAGRICQRLGWYVDVKWLRYLEGQLFPLPTLTAADMLLSTRFCYDSSPTLFSCWRISLPSYLTCLNPCSFQSPVVPVALHTNMSPLH